MRRAALLSFLLLSLSCKSDRPKRLVGMSPKGASHIFWQTVHAGAVKAGNEYGLEIEWNAPTIEIDASRQIAIVESMINRHLAGISVAPVDRKSLVSAIDRASDAGIPVAIFDSDIDTAKRISFVATDNKESGRLAARTLAELVKDKGTVAIVGFMPGSASTMEREAGFTEEIQKHPAIELVATVFGQASQATAMRETENLLTRYPRLAGLFADNESSSLGAVAALKARSNENTRLVAYDASDQLVQDLRHKFVDALLVQDPFRMGYESIRAIGMKLRGETPQSRIDLPITLINRYDTEKPDVVTLLYPDVKKYLNPPAR